MDAYEVTILEPWRGRFIARSLAPARLLYRAPARSEERALEQATYHWRREFGAHPSDRARYEVRRLGPARRPSSGLSASPLMEVRTRRRDGRLVTVTARAGSYPGDISVHMPCLDEGDGPADGVRQPRTPGPSSGAGPVRLPALRRLRR